MKWIKNLHNVKWNYIKIKNFLCRTLYDHFFSEYNFNIFLYVFQNHHNSLNNSISLAHCYIRLFLYFLFFNFPFFINFCAVFYPARAITCIKKVIIIIMTIMMILMMKIAGDVRSKYSERYVIVIWMSRLLKKNNCFLTSILFFGYSYFFFWMFEFKQKNQK